MIPKPVLELTNRPFADFTLKAYPPVLVVYWTSSPGAVGVLIVLLGLASVKGQGRCLVPSENAREISMVDFYAPRQQTLPRTAIRTAVRSFLFIS